LSVVTHHKSHLFYESYLRNGFWFKIKADAKFKPEEYFSISRI